VEEGRRTGKREGGVGKVEFRREEERRKGK
jgi:hypothetical protein